MGATEGGELDPGLEGAGQGSGCPGEKADSAGPNRSPPTAPCPRRPLTCAALRCGLQTRPGSARALAPGSSSATALPPAPATLLPTPAGQTLGGARRSASLRIPGCLAKTCGLTQTSELPEARREAPSPFVLCEDKGTRRTLQRGWRRPYFLSQGRGK